MKSSPAKTPRNSMFTNSKNAKETAHPVTNPVKVDVGAMEKTIVRNSPKRLELPVTVALKVSTMFLQFKVARLIS